MHELGQTSHAPRRDTDRYRSDVTAAVSMATPDGHTFERLLGQPRTAAGRRAAADAPASRADAGATSGNARAEEAPVREGDARNGPQGRTNLRGIPIMGACLRPGVGAQPGLELPASSREAAAAALQDRDAADYARLLEHVRNTLKTVTGQEATEPAPGETPQAKTGGAVPDPTAGQQAAVLDAFDPAAAVIKGLKPLGEPMPADPAPAPAPAPAQVPAEEIRAQVAAQLAGKLGGLGGKGQLKFELTPPELGRVEIRFTREGDHLHLQFRVESAAAARALMDGAGPLQELLLGRNDHWTRIDIDVEQDEEAEARRERRQDDPDASDDRDLAGRGDVESDHRPEEGETT